MYVCPASPGWPRLREPPELHKSEGTTEGTLATWGRSHPLGCIGQPWDIAEAVAFLASGKARFITGADFKVDGGLLAKLGVVLPE